ncbi:MAG TPA: DUF6191 domain-containing protein [Jatrophihabitantaceae bacterium]|jgi:hypothetical protein|nr:DUF6191 domain-containing protein [Jatrophihabitantaceae bacterium]
MTQWGVDTLFNPAKRHMDEEKRRLQATRAEVGDNSGGRRIDLASGKVRISRGAKDPDAEQLEPAEDDAADEDADGVAAPADARADAASAEDVQTVAAEESESD